MTDISAPYSTQHIRTGFSIRLELILSFVVGLWIFSGAFVMVEPSGFELLFPLVILVAILAGLQLYRASLFILITGALFTLFGFVSNFKVVHTATFEASEFMAVTGFLVLTSFFLANYVAQKPLERSRFIFRVYSVGAVITALLGILGFFDMVPGAENFLKFGRAKGTFKDPNVFGPFLMLPVAWLIAQLILQPVFARPLITLLRLASLGILILAIFLSFSRASWAYVLITSLLVALLVYKLEADATQAKRLFGFIFLGLIVAVAALLFLSSNQAVTDLFEIRALATQNYDTGPQGRFGRQAGIFWQILENPLGIGVYEFSYGPIYEEPHNTYFKVFLYHGWVGGLAFWALVIGTFAVMITGLCVRSPLRLPLIILSATYIPLMIEAAIIDIDHWRHFYVITGMIFGLSIAIRFQPRFCAVPPHLPGRIPTGHYLRQKPLKNQEPLKKQAA